MQGARRSTLGDDRSARPLHVHSVVRVLQRVDAAPPPPAFRQRLLGGCHQLPRVLGGVHSAVGPAADAVGDADRFSVENEVRVLAACNPEPLLSDKHGTCNDLVETAASWGLP